MDDLISVRLTGPAKIGGKWRKPGEDVSVTPDLARELAAAGAIADSDAQALADLAPGMPDYDHAVQAMAKVLAEAAVQAAVEATTAELIADRDAARARADEAETEVSRQLARIMRLEAEIADLSADRTQGGADVSTVDAVEGETPNTAPTAEPPAKNARKGAAVKKG